MKRLIKKLQSNLDQDIPNNHGLHEHHKDRGDCISAAYFEGRRDYAKKMQKIIDSHSEMEND